MRPWVENGVPIFTGLLGAYVADWLGGNAGLLGFIAGTAVTGTVVFYVMPWLRHRAAHSHSLPPVPPRERSDK